MRKNIKSWCPAFPGLYESFYVNSDMDSSEIHYFVSSPEFELTKEQEKTVLEEMCLTTAYDDCFNAYVDLIVRNHCDSTAAALSEILGCDVVILNAELVSPRFYNFATDSINCDIDIDLDIVLIDLEYRNTFSRLIWDRSFRS